MTTPVASADKPEQPRAPGWASHATPILVGILLLSISLRVGMAVYLGAGLEGQPGTADQLSYHTLAIRVLEGHGFTFAENWWPATRAGAPTAHWSYLYTLLLAAVYAMVGASPVIARLLQAVLTGILFPLLVFYLGRLAYGRAVGLVGAALAAGYAYFVYYAASLMTEMLYCISLLAMFLSALLLVREAGPEARRSPTASLWLALSLGLTLAAASLLRQLVLIFVPFMVIWFWRATRRQRPARWVAGRLALALGVLAAFVLPITAFNYARFGRPVLLNTNAGFAIFWANHPIHGAKFQPILESSYGDLIPAELKGLGEAELDQELFGRGLRFVSDDPVRYVLLSLSRIPVFFRFWPSSQSSPLSNVSRVASFGVLWPLMLYGVVRAIRTWGPVGTLRRSGTELLLLFAAVYTVIHILSWALIRYRLPVDAVLLVFAGVGLSHLALRIRLARPTLGTGLSGSGNVRVARG